MNKERRSRFQVPGSRFVLGCACLFAVLGFAGSGFAEVTKVTITAKTPVADGQAFGTTGPYEKLVGTIEFAIDPSLPQNRVIVDLEHAKKDADGKVHFTADLFVLQPVDAARGNQTMLFEISNRGGKGMLGRFNRAPGSNDPTTAAHMGDGFLMREGYTLVWVGWQFDVAAPGLRVEAPEVSVPGEARVSFILNDKATQATLGDLPPYPPANPADPASTLTVRNLFWDAPTTLARGSWRFDSPAANGRHRLLLDSGFEPGRVYELQYRTAVSRVAGVGMAAVRDAASAFRTRTDLPVRGQRAYVFGISQSGRFLRQFLNQGFNVDERNRRVFDLVWPHIAGAGQGSFNERLAMPGYSSFPALRTPYAALEDRYRGELQPKIIYTNTPVEYWGQGRAAALTHTSPDGARDLTLPDNVRSYLLAGTQHGEAAFPPPAGQGQAPGNPMPQGDIMRALLRAAHRWVTESVPPPPSRVPRVSDRTLTRVADVRFPAIPGAGNPRVLEGPKPPLPHLVPQVDADGNDIAGVRAPEVAVPLATTTGWNFRSERIGNPTTPVALLGAYFAFPKTRAERAAKADPRLSIEERYTGKADYLSKIRAAAADLVNQRLMLEEDVDLTMQRAARHWDWATAR
jgi:hypothetical protein